MNEIKKAWFKKGNMWEVFACRAPYTRKDIIVEGVPYEVWITLENYESKD